MQEVHRIISPTMTLDRVKPLFKEIGLTRIANVTGLDRVGIPVVSVCRPNARSNAVCQGKGLTLEAAKASGVMESIETHCAEHIIQPLLYASADEMSKNKTIADIGRLSRTSGSSLSVDTKLMWIEGRLLADNAPCFLPFELVHADFTVPRPPSSGNFLLSTNGLASGNTVTEAILHGVCEVIERDATTLNNLNRQFDETRRLDLDSIDDGDCLTLVEMIHTADLTLAVWDITSDIAITTFRCQIMENARGAHAITLPAEGYGCHPNRTVALVRAITEAAQSRVTAISGARDDMRPNLYGLGDDPTLLENWRHILKSTKGDHKFQDIQTAELKTTDEELRLVLSKLSAAGFIDIITVDISPFPAELCAVVRVVIPGLEGPMHGAYLPGSRGLPSSRPIP